MEPISATLYKTTGDGSEFSCEGGFPPAGHRCNQEKHCYVLPHHLISKRLIQLIILVKTEYAIMMLLAQN